MPLLPSPALAKAAPKALPARHKPKLIALDPGHGGRIPALWAFRGTQEKGVVIRVARELQAQLQLAADIR